MDSIDDYFREENKKNKNNSFARFHWDRSKEEKKFVILFLFDNLAVNPLHIIHTPYSFFFFPFFLVGGFSFGVLD